MAEVERCEAKNETLGLRCDRIKDHADPDTHWEANGQYVDVWGPDLSRTSASRT